MTTYKLDENSDTYISAVVEEGSYVYRMYSVKGESNYTELRNVDLRKDKLIIYGTEIKESVREKLHMSLLLRSGAGRIFVNCNGACYILVTGKGVYRAIENVTFDWSSLGVIVPNSAYDVLRKQQQQKDEELAAMSSLVSSAKGEALANKDGWEATKQELEKLIIQLSACQKEELDKEMELQKVRNQLSVKEFELEATNFMFKLSKEEVKQLQDHVSTYNKEDYRNIEMEMQKVQQQLSSTMSELNSMKVMWDFSKEQLESSNKENEEMKVELKTMQDQVSSVVSELQSIKIELESSNKIMEELECKLLTRGMENQDTTTELQRVQNEPLSDKSELQLTKSRWESSNKKIIKLEEQVLTCEKVKDQVSLIMNELQSVNILFDFTAEKEELRDQCSDNCYVIKAIDIVDDQSI